MTTMRRWLNGVSIATTLLTTGAHILAADPPTKRVVPGGQSTGISSVTDGEGNPIELKTLVANPAAAARTQVVLRGRAWWPYATPLASQSSSPKRVEALTEDEIIVNGGTLLNVRDLEASRRDVPKELLIKAGAQLAEADGFYLVKITGRSRTQAQIEALTNAGAVLGEYLNVNTYIAKIPSASFAAVKALPFVSFVGDYEPAYKISPRIGMEEVPVDEAIDAVTGQARPWALEVVLHNGAYVNDVLSEMARLGILPDADDFVSNDAMTFLRVRAVPDAIPALAKIPGVKWIGEKTYPKLLASASNPAAIPMVLQNNGVYTTTTAVGWKLWNAGIDGTGQIVTMMDSGLNTKMEHFSQDILSNGTPGPAHRKVVAYEAFGGGNVCVADDSAADGGHGAKTSQHAVGSISNMTVNPDVTHTPTVHWDNGIARGAKVYFQDIGTDVASSVSPPSDLGPSIVAAIGKGSFVQNHSWGAANNSYDPSAMNLDTALFTNPDMVVTVSSGNRGAAGGSTLGSPSTAKNVICVGGNDVSSSSNLFIDCSWDGVGTCSTADLGSSRGPVSGVGRTKPDIMTYIYSTATVGGEIMATDKPSQMCQTDPTKTVYFDYANTTLEGGTSFAAPEVAGLAALVRDYFQKGFYPTGTATPANALTPSGALVKAVILASGEAMATTSFPSPAVINARYSSDVGYGRANLPGALHIGAGAPFLWVQNNATLPDGQTKSFVFNINGNGTPLRVMMVYYDAAGDALQKDADLKVTIVGGNTYWGNNFNAGWSTSATAIQDHTNNTEGVFLDAAHGLPASGSVRVDVIGFNNPFGMPYSLVVVGDVANQAVTQVALEKGVYTCNDAVKITVNDIAATSPVSVTLVSKDSASATIDTEIVSCTGSNGVFVGTIQTGSGITVADGGSLTATYPGAISQPTATVACQMIATDSGFSIGGGCDNNAAGTDTVTSPLFNGGTNEYYTKYMDAGEYSSYTFKFKNTTGVPLTDATVNLSFSGAGASKLSVFNNPVHIGPVDVDGVVGGVFQIFTDPSAAALTAVNLDFDITSPGDGLTLAQRLTQQRLLQANDQVTRLDSCSTFNTSLGSWTESKVNRPGVTTQVNSWHWGGATQATGSEVRTDGACGNATANNSVAMTGGATTTGNFNNNADSFLLLNFQPALRGNGPSGQPYRYVWKWHSFYHASEAFGNQGGFWGTFYNNAWNNAVAPTGDQMILFPFALAYYPQSFFFDYVSTWNWDVANGGTPDNPHLGPSSGGAPNQVIISFNDTVTGPATSTTYFAYGHEHLDSYFFDNVNNPPQHGVHRDIALDNDRLVYDELYAAPQAGASCGGGGQLGQVAFNLSNYTTCPSGTAVLSVVDANGASGMQVTVTSPGTLDSEVVTLTGTAPYFSGNLTLATNAGLGVNNGVLFVLPNETISASYTDASPAGATVASAVTDCVGGNVVYLSKAQIVDNGDNDGNPDNNETVTIDITVKNNLATPLTNAKVTIFPATNNIDCISDPQALYGTIAAGASATNPGGDRFTFHVNSAVACADPANPPLGRFIVVITGDGFDGPATLQSFIVNLDLDPTASGGAYNYTQDFNSDPLWETGVTPDDTQPAPACDAFVNDFHWCAACGNGNGGYGAWVGNAAFGTAGQNYTEAPSSSTLYSPPFVANGNVGLQFAVAYRTELGYDGAIAQYSLNGGTWTTLPYSTPAQSALGPDDFCSPYNPNQSSWNGSATGTAWTTTNAANVPSSVGQTIQFRWRLGGDSAVVGTGYGGLGVDNVSITNLKQTVTCEPTRNTGLPSCANAFCAANPGAACDDGNGCTTGDICSAGNCTGTPITAPAETQSVTAAANKTTYSWTPTASATRYDVVRGALGAFPVGPGGGDETCFDDLAVASVVDASVPAPGTGFWYLPRAENSCGNGTYGTQGVHGSPGAARTSTTCP